MPLSPDSADDKIHGLEPCMSIPIERLLKRAPCVQTVVTETWVTAPECWHASLYKASTHFCRLEATQQHLAVLHPNTSWEDLWHCPGLCVVTIYSITSTPSGFSLTDLNPSNTGKRSSERPGTELICLSPQTNTCTKVRAVVFNNTMLLTLAASFTVQEHEIKCYL